MRFRMALALAWGLAGCTPTRKESTEADTRLVEVVSTANALMPEHDPTPGFSLEFVRSQFGDKYDAHLWRKGGYEIYSRDAMNLYAVCTLKYPTGFNSMTKIDRLERPFVIERWVAGDWLESHITWDPSGSPWIEVANVDSSFWFPIPSGSGSFRFGLIFKDPTKTQGHNREIHVWTPELRVCAR